MNEEIWKDIEGYEGLYQVSNIGRVKSLKRIDSAGRQRKEKILKPCNLSGYFAVLLCKESNPQIFTIHRLVAKAFIPNTENKPEVNHIDGVKTNNRVDNLEWVTSDENKKHASISGLYNAPKGEKNWQAAFTNEQIQHIRNEYVYGSKENNLYTLAKKYGVSKNVIRCIVNNQTYTDNYYGAELSKKAKPKLRPAAKLTPKQVIEIRSIYTPWDKEYGGRALAKKYGVSPSTIRDLFRKNGRTFDDVE